MRRRRDRPVVLITGFGPFPEVPDNASAALVEELAHRADRALPGLAIVAAILPSEWAAAPRHLEALLKRHDPDMALHFGVSDKARGFVIETVARNVTCTSIDAACAVPPQSCLEEHAPGEMRVTLDADALASRLQARGLSVALSEDAGTYICNAVLFYSLRHAHARTPPMLAGFIHIPDRLAPPSVAGAIDQSIGRDALASALDWQSAIAGGIEIISACLEQLRCAATTDPR